MEYQPASFRGFKFNVDSEQVSGGLRHTIREIPTLDIPLYFISGNQAITYDVAAYCIGDNQIEQRDALLRILQQKKAGNLVLPNEPEPILAVAAKYATQHTSQKLGYTKISISFVRVQEKPIPSVDFAGVLANKLPKLQQAATDQFADSFVNIPNAQEQNISVIDAAFAQIKQARAVVAGVASNIDAVRYQADVINDNITALLQSPAKIADAIVASINSIKSVIDIEQHAQTFVNALLGFKRIEISLASTSTADAPQNQDNTQATNALLAQSQITQNVVMGTEHIVPSLLSVSIADAPQYQSNIEATNAFLTQSQFIQIASVLPKVTFITQQVLDEYLTDFDTVFAELPAVNYVDNYAVRGLVAAAVNQHNQLLPILSQYQQTTPLPLVVIAHKIGVTAAHLRTHNNFLYEMEVSGTIQYVRPH